ncbi:unnamed protein product, partial [Urochloa humidicola]
ARSRKEAARNPPPDHRNPQLRRSRRIRGRTMEGPPRSWADLPLELAGLVLGRLPSHLDRFRFAAVCPQWCSAARQVRLPPPPPLLALKNGRTFYSMPAGEPLRVHFPDCDNGFPTFNREQSDFRTASGNWLVYRQFSSLLLLDPFSGA